MTCIPCGEKCIHQREGFCTLEQPAAVTDSGSRGCIHRVRPESSFRRLNRPEQQQRPLSF